MHVNALNDVEMSQILPVTTNVSISSEEANFHLNILRLQRFTSCSFILGTFDKHQFSIADTVAHKASRRPIVVSRKLVLFGLAKRRNYATTIY